MKLAIILLMILYIIATLGAAFYSHFKTRRMASWRFWSSLIICGIVGVTLYFYSQAYLPLQMVSFSLSFTLLSSLFFFTGDEVRGELVLIFHFFRFITHIQLLVLLYLLR